MSRKRIGKVVEAAQVDGNKMGGYESKMRMDDMPIDWVEQVISFLPLTDVYNCKYVCMAWNVAADRVLSDWETIVIVTKEGSGSVIAENENHIFLNGAETWTERLKPLVRLKRIFVPGRYIRFKLLDVDDVVLRNANTLTLLHMGLEQLPFDLKRPVVFSNLRDLECIYLLNPDLVAALPRLVKLRVRTSSVKVLQKLPAETLTSLQIDYIKPETGSHEEMEQLVAALSRFTRLKSLILVEGFTFSPGQWTELHDRAFSQLFKDMTELEEVDIKFPQNGVVTVDAAIETLVLSPSVRSITMHYARMTDAGLHSLSRLTGLQHVDIASFWRKSDITTEGILSLLRGGSRNVLQDLKFNVSVMPDLDQIRAEGHAAHAAGIGAIVVRRRH